MLEPIGLSDDEEKVYLTLLGMPGARITKLATEAGISTARAQDAVSGLEASGLLTRSPGADAPLIPAPPDIAIQSLVVRREEELDRVRATVSELAERFRERAKANGRQEEPVQVIRGREAIVQTYLQLQRGLTERYAAFDRPPYASTAAQCNPVTMQCLERGIDYRVVYDPVTLERPGQVQMLETLITAGERARLSEVPMKLAIADGRAALIPLGSSEAGIDDALLVHPSALLEALNRLFEELWRQAQPVHLRGRSGESPDPAEDLSPADAKILGLLAAGMQDAAIARQLDVSRRTVERRVARMLDLLGARTRFQAALLAHERGWFEGRAST